MSSILFFKAKNFSTYLNSFMKSTGVWTRPVTVWEQNASNFVSISFFDPPSMATVLTLSPNHFVNSFCQFLTSEDGETTILKGAIGFPSGPFVGLKWSLFYYTCIWWKTSRFISIFNLFLLDKGPNQRNTLQCFPETHFVSHDWTMIIWDWNAFQSIFSYSIFNKRYSPPTK